MEPSRSGNTDEENTGEDRGETYRQDRGKLLVKTERNLSSRPKETYRQDPGKLIVKIQGNLSSRSRETYHQDPGKLIVELEEIQTRMGQLCYCCKAQSFQR